MSSALVQIALAVAGTAVFAFLGGLIVFGGKAYRVINRMHDDMAVVKPAVQNGTSIVEKADKLDRAVQQIQAGLKQHLKDSAEDRKLLLETTEALRSHIERHQP